MRKIYIIGTIHNMFPKHKDELRRILEKINPGQVLVEIAKEDLKTKKIRKYPKEMIFAYKWAIKNKKKANGFGADIDSTKKNITKKQLKKVEEEFYNKYGKYNWKWFNKKKNWDKGMEVILPAIDIKKKISEKMKCIKM